MEKKLGRFLDLHVVHHINGNKQDNRIENLQLMTKSEHVSLHLRERKTQTQTCLLCNSSDVIKHGQRANKKKRRWYCNKCSRYFTTLSYSFIKWTKTGNIQMLSEQGYPYENGT